MPADMISIAMISAKPGHFVKGRHRCSRAAKGASLHDWAEAWPAPFPCSQATRTILAVPRGAKRFTRAMWTCISAVCRFGDLSGDRPALGAEGMEPAQARIGRKAGFGRGRDAAFVAADGQQPAPALGEGQKVKRQFEPVEHHALRRGAPHRLQVRGKHGAAGRSGCISLSALRLRGSMAGRNLGRDGGGRSSGRTWGPSILIRPSCTTRMNLTRR